MSWNMRKAKTWCTYKYCYKKYIVNKYYCNIYGNILESAVCAFLAFYFGREYVMVSNIMLQKSMTRADRIELVCNTGNSLMSPSDWAIYDQLGIQAVYHCSPVVFLRWTLPSICHRTYFHTSRGHMTWIIKNVNRIPTHCGVAYESICSLARGHVIGVWWYMAVLYLWMEVILNVYPWGEIFSFFNNESTSSSHNLFIKV